MKDASLNKRTGIGFQRAVEFVWIRDCYIEAKPPTTVDCIHFEPTRFGTGGNQAPTDIVIDGNVLVQGTAATAVGIAGMTDGTDPALRVKFINNTVQGGGIEVFNTQEITVANNTIVAGERGQVITFRGVKSACSDLRFSNNKIVAAGGARTALRIASDVNFITRRVWIESNYIETPRFAIELTGSNHDIVITGNTMTHVGSFVPEAAIRLDNAAGILISGNNISASPQASAIAMRANSDEWRIVGNHFSPGRYNPRGSEFDNCK